MINQDIISKIDQTNFENAVKNNNYELAKEIVINYDKNIIVNELQSIFVYGFMINYSNIYLQEMLKIAPFKITKHLIIDTFKYALCHEEITDNIITFLKNLDFINDLDFSNCDIYFESTWMASFFKTFID